jgi:hypothetical protein
MKSQEVGENCITRSFITFTFLQVRIMSIIRMINLRRMRWVEHVDEWAEVECI